MDGSRFDTLTRALSPSPSRRRILQTLVAAFSADAVGVVRGHAAACPDTCLTDGDCAACRDAVCQLAYLPTAHRREMPAQPPVCFG